MSASSATESPEARELSLVSKVELRIALADTDEKLQRLLQTYLAPLLLKLASDSLAVRNKVISVCQHINTRIKPQSIQLPVPALLKQFKEQSSQLIRHFDLIYIQKGLDRLDASVRAELLPTALEGVAKLDASSPQAAVMFNLILRLLPLLKLPPKGSPEDASLKEKLNLSDDDTRFLAFWLGKLLLLSPAAPNTEHAPGLSKSEYKFLNKSSSFAEVWDASKEGGLNLTETKVAAAKFLASGAFTNFERFIPAVIASADPNSRISNIGDEMLKRFSPALDDAEVVDKLYRLYLGTEGQDLTLPVHTPLRIKILGYLGKSVKATTYTDRILRVLDDGLFSDMGPAAQGLQASKLRAQIFTFLTWVVRVGAAPDLRAIAPRAVEGLREFISSQGWPDPSLTGQKLSHSDVTLRGSAYEAIGILAPKVPNEDGSDSGTLDMDVVRWLFTSLASDGSGPEIHVSIEQALGSVLNACSGNTTEDAQAELDSLLRKHMMNGILFPPGSEDPDTGYKLVRSTRYAAVRYTNRCLPYSHSTARFIDLLAISSGDKEGRELTEEGRKGLDPYWFRLMNPTRDGTPLPTSEEAPEDAWYRFPEFTAMTRDLAAFYSTESAQSHLDLAPMIRFCKLLLVREAFLRSQIPAPIDHDWERRIDTLLSSDGAARAAVGEYICQLQEPSVLQIWLRDAISGLCRHTGTSAAECGKDFVEIASLTPNNLLESVVDRAIVLLDRAFSINDPVTQNITAKAVGILLSHPSFPEHDCQEVYAGLLTRLSRWKETFGQAAVQVRGALLAAAYILNRLSYRARISVIPDNQVKETISLVLDILVNSHDTQFQTTAQLIVGQLALSKLLNPAILLELGYWESVKSKLIQNGKKEQESAIIALGRLSLVFPVNGDDRKALLDSLCSLYEIRKPEVQFSVGEALSTAVAGWASKSLIGEFDVDATAFESDIPGSVLAEMTDKVIDDSHASKPSLRKASVIWLLCLVKYCGHLPGVQSRLRKCQAAFTGVLAERDELVQECGSRGLTLVYEMGDQELRDDLVHDLVRSFTSTGPNLSGKVTGDTQLFEQRALPTGDNSSITTYKDILNLASEVGDPSLVYRFMSLASNNAIWASRAAFGRFGLSSVLSDSSVNGYLSKNPKIYPKLYRYRFDPNPNVQRSMNDIWQALVKDPNAVLDTHFDAIMEDLLSNILSGKEWRVRQACCAAIADLLQGRKVEKYDKYLNEILTKAFKVLDDIKESVRAAALRLCQAITNMLIQTLETGDTTSKRAQVMLGHVVPFLLGSGGMESSAQNVQAYAITTLIQIVKKCPNVLLRPYIPQILEKFLASLSSLEPQAVNYIHLNADKYGLTGDEIDRMRLSSIRMSPMMETIERYLLDGLDEPSMKDTATSLEGVLRTAVGLPSKVGCSRVLVHLSTRSYHFRPYADKFVQLLKKHVLDRNDTVSVSYSYALGYLMRLASDGRVVDTIEFAKGLYFDAQEPRHRVVSGEIIHSMAKLSSDRFAHFAAAALPFVFVAKHDTDEHVRDPFEKTWQDHVGGPRAVSLYLSEILHIVSERLDSQSWAIKHTAAFAAAAIVTSLDSSLDQTTTAEAVWPVLEKALGGKTWDGKETVLNAFVKFTTNAKSTWQHGSVIGEKMKVKASMRLAQPF